jgi:predicted phosphodiesterase
MQLHAIVLLNSMALPLRPASRPSRWSRAARLALAMTALAATSGCLQVTPFGSEPENRDLTAKNLEALAARPERSGPIKIAALGDTHDDYDRFAKAVELINARGDIDLVLHAGGMSDRGLLQELEWTAEILTRLEMPFFAVIGNHDAISEGKAIYPKMFGPTDFSFEWSGTKFVVFNSNTLEFPGEAPNRTWLSETLAERDSAARLVVLTHQAPHFSDDLPGGTNTEYYQNLLKTADIDVYIHGHVEPFSLTTPFGPGTKPVLALGTFQKVPYYTVLTVDPELTTIRYERCELEVCEEILSPPMGTQ